MKKVLDATRRDMRFRKKLVHFSDEELRVVLENAERWTKGNANAWIRFAAIKFRPKKCHIVEKVMTIQETGYNPHWGTDDEDL